MVSKELLERAKEFHGHMCPFLVLGLRASEIALNRLGIKKLSCHESITEDVIAIVEVNNCLVDGVQVATGCTLGNNSLIYVDLGKNAVTLCRRGDKRCVRVYIDADRIKSKYFPKEVLDLFKKVVADRAGSEEEVEELSRAWSELGYKLANIPEEDFMIQEIELISDVGRAPIFESIRCSNCGELVMSTKAVYANGRYLCPTCAKVGSPAIIGRGIVNEFELRYKVIKS